MRSQDDPRARYSSDETCEKHMEGEYTSKGLRKRRALEEEEEEEEKKGSFMVGTT